MSSNRLVVDGFPGEAFIVHAASTSVVRTEARSIVSPPGWFVSRAYRRHYGLVGIAPARIGIDIEIVDPSLTADSVLTSRERALEAGPLEMCSWWSAKEALAKALGDARQYDPRRLDSPALWPFGRQGRWMARKLDVPAGFVGWVVWETGSSPIDSETSAGTTLDATPQS